MNRFLFVFLFLSLSIKAQNTTTLPENTKSPNATLSDISWMQGNWSGEAFGGITEEIWGPPSGGSMMFSFKLVADGKVSFYELGHIRELNKTLVYELKHFNADLKGWEEKDDVQSFKLVKVEANRVYFEGFTFEKVSDNEINIYAQIGNEDGSAQEVIFNFKK
ncbi:MULTISPECIES: DUF6265 family protein [Zobellia]|uniref:DUF6265 family protein n=1 Tax=Zobellia TaxID=112040 RepID=UPI001BFF973F|nr:MULTISPECIES: DUF6265 family protein [Zobellia]MBT9186691.1 hypothetical protein [Zobellia russellii]MDO6820697.1 DUF6265 family protein [Zobellia sp. 1_MG-2023]